MAWFQNLTKKRDDREVHYRIHNRLAEPIQVYIFNEDPEELQEDDDDDEDSCSDHSDDSHDELYNGFAPLTYQLLVPGEKWTHKKQYACADCHVGTIKVDATVSDRSFFVDAQRALAEKSVTYKIMTTICNHKKSSEEEEEERPVVVNLTLDVRVEDDPPNQENEEATPLLVNLVVQAIPARSSFQLPPPETLQVPAPSQQQQEDTTATHTCDTEDGFSTTSVQGMLARLQDIETMISIGHDVPDSLDEQLSERSKLSELSERSSKLSQWSERSTNNNKLSQWSERSTKLSRLSEHNTALLFGAGDK